MLHYMLFAVSFAVTLGRYTRELRIGLWRWHRPYRTAEEWQGCYAEVTYQHNRTWVAGWLVVQPHTSGEPSEEEWETWRPRGRYVDTVRA